MLFRSKVCVLTGAGGFIGSRLKHYLERAGWRVIPWTRQPEPGSGGVAFRLGQDVDPQQFEGVTALVHGAYDFGPRRWEDIVATNVAGSQKVLEAARKAGVRSVVFISSISAFPGSRSLYGKGKMAVEEFARSMQAHVIRPGLVYSDKPGAIFGRLVSQVRGSRFLPIVWGGNQTQYMLHDEDLGRVVQGLLEDRISGRAEPLTLAHPHGCELKDILTQIAQALGRRITFVPVTWQCVWVVLKSLDLAGAQFRFPSDSLTSMVFQNEHPAFASAATLGFELRPFKLAPGMLG